MYRFFSLNSLIFIVLLSTILLVNGTIYLIASSLQETALSSLAREGAANEGLVAYKDIVTALGSGNSEKVETTLRTLNKYYPASNISIIRGPLVSKQYGDASGGVFFAALDPSVRQALSSKEHLRLIDLGSSSSYYPLITTPDCISCHTSAKAGDVLGVIAFHNSSTTIETLLQKLLSSFMLTCVILGTLVCATLFLGINYLVIQPLEEVTRLNNALAATGTVELKYSNPCKLKELVALMDSIYAVLRMIQIKEKQLRLRDRRSILPDSFTPPIPDRTPHD